MGIAGWRIGGSKIIMGKLMGGDEEKYLIVRAAIMCLSFR